MGEMLLLLIFGVLAFYFFGSMNVYRSMYNKIKEEHQLTIDINNLKDNDINKCESQIHEALDTIKQMEKKMAKLKLELQRERAKGHDLKYENEKLQKKIDELYASIGVI